MLKTEWHDFVGKVLRKYAMDKAFPEEFDYIRSQITTMQDLGTLITSLTKAKDKKIRYCPGCFSDLQHIIQARKFGCQECYKVFGDDVVTKIFKIAKHVGKHPRKSKYVEQLIVKMNVAAAQERYEEAAELRNLIREMKTRE